MCVCSDKPNWIASMVVLQSHASPSCFSGHEAPEPVRLGVGCFEPL